MRAALYNQFGPPNVVEIGDIPVPQPKPGEVLVRVQAAALNPKDCLMRRGKFRRLSPKGFPKGIGFDFAGEIIELGSDVRDMQRYQRVFGMRNGWVGGTVAEYITVLADELAVIDSTSADLPDVVWAALPLAAQTALQALRDCADLSVGRVGQRVLINGASGGVGTMAVQIAKYLGAEVTAVCSAANSGLMRELGADHVIDYHSTDVLAGGGPAYDVCFDVFGKWLPAQVDAILAPGGRFVSTVPNRHTIAAHAKSRFTIRKRKRYNLVIVKSNRADLNWLRGLVGSGALRPIVDKTYDLAQIIPAQRYLETKRARGKVVIKIC